MIRERAVVLALVLAASPAAWGQEEKADGAAPECGVVKVTFRLPDETLRRSGIEWVKAAKRPFSESLLLSAEMVHREDARVQVRARFGGVVVEARRTYGDAVEAGEVLAVLDSGEVAEARGARVAAHADHRSAAEALAAEREASGSALDALRRLVDEGRPLAEEALRRVRDLAKQGLGTEKERLEAERALLAETLGAERDLALAVLDARTRLAAAEGAERRAAAGFRAADARLAALGFTAEERKALDSGEFDGRVEIRSPLAGAILERAAAPGATVEEGAALFDVAEDARLVAVVRVPEREIPLVEPGRPAGIAVPAHPGRVFKGKVLSVGRALDPATRTAAARVLVGNSRGLLRAGMLGTASIEVRTPGPALAVPTEAIQSDGCCRIVFVRKREGVVGVRRVRPGLEAEAWTEVLEGLAEGEEVIGRGAFTLKAEMLRAKFGSGCCDLE